MRLLIIGNNFHHKNKNGLDMIIHYLSIEHKYGSTHDIDDFDVIYSPYTPIDTSEYPTKKFIFGPQFSVFPDNKLTLIKNTCHNSVYIQPSEWVKDVWADANRYLPIHSFPFPVDMGKFKPNNEERNKVFLYIKRRHPNEIQFMKNFLHERKIEYVVFDYVKRYNENDYLTTLQQAKYGIILDAHESQGFAIQEAMSCNVPLLVWNVRTLNQEHGSNYPKVFATSIEYWDERCGEYFYEKEELSETFEKFQKKIEQYEPRKYIEENLSVEKCSERFVKLIYQYS
jgi:glycosyltransferase involved in cell wall biosynthesis